MNEFLTLWAVVFIVIMIGRVINYVLWAKEKYRAHNIIQVILICISVLLLVLSVIEAFK